MPYGTDMPDLYVCGSAGVAYVLGYADNMLVESSLFLTAGTQQWNSSISNVNDRRQRTVDGHSA